MSIDLSDDQAAARDAVLDALADGECQLVLAGPAGTGKTTLMRYLLDEFDGAGTPCTLLAPTGKAAVRLSELTGRTASTVHRPLYGRHARVKYAKDDDGHAVPVLASDDEGVLEFYDPRAVLGRGVVVCDEASMLGRRLYADLWDNLPPGVALLCVGDREQLPPVNDTWGARFDAPTALLTQIHRQAEGSPIIQLATRIRTQQDWRYTVPDGTVYDVQSGGGLVGAAHWLALERAVGADATLLCWTNRVRQRLNSLVRELRGFKTPLEIGDYVVCTFNNYKLGIMNGEVEQVAAFDLVDGSDGQLAEVKFTSGRDAVLAVQTLAAGRAPDDDQRLAELCDRCDSKRPAWQRFASRWSLGARLMKAEYGECLTVHKSQGSQWDAVGFVYDAMLDGLERSDADTHRRLCYTAVTRAAQRLVLFDVGRV